jgi:hypothetical protein
MFRYIALRNDIGGCRLTVHGARDRFLRGLIVEVLDLLVVVGVPMDEHAHTDEQIVRFLDGNRAPARRSPRARIGQRRAAIEGEPAHAGGSVE